MPNFKDKYPKDDSLGEMNPHKQRREEEPGDAGDDAKDD